MTAQILRANHLPAAPAHWQWARLSRAVRFRNGADYKEVESDASGYPVYGSGGQFSWASAWLHDGPSVLFGRKGTIDHPLYVEGRFWTVDTMFYTVPDESIIHPKFLYFWATRFPFGKYMSNTALPSMTQSDLGSEPLALPPLPEQRAIADFLDHETAEIDAFIADLHHLEEASHERQWSRLRKLLAYPQNFSSLWKRSEANLVHLKRLGTITLGKMLDPTPPEKADESVRYLRAANVQPMGRLDLDDMKTMRFTAEETRRLTLCAGDVVIVEGGVGGYGRAAFLPQDLIRTGFQNSIIRFRSSTETDGRYIAYALLLLRHMGYIETVASVASMPHFTVEKVANTPIPNIAIGEQRRIASILDDEWRKEATLNGELQAAVELARERRAALISAAVTGQIDVTKKRKPTAEVLEDELEAVR